ncbi:hypothetical protein HK097_002421 [Rhizophlyctis rosea]|uniref:HAM1-like N-terminal domain-containing protein n=1 Tax=Rhizophlyctis rosea TaxID=64517 RepID=A0AAD5X759_9FUNG|nr:hypothetical protein HK097_002421 [Rhizophlyctis rosea]
MPTYDYYEEDDVPHRRGTRSSIASSLRRSASSILPRGSTALAYPKPKSAPDDRSYATSASVTIADGDIAESSYISVLAALRDGNLPNNQQLEAIFATLKASTSDDAADSKLTPDGKTVRKDLDQLVDSLRKVLVEKNDEEDLQQFVYHARQAAGVMNKDAGADGLDMDNLFSNVSNLARVLLGSEDFKQYLTQLNAVFQKMLEGFDLNNQTSSGGDDTLDDAARQQLIKSMGTTLRTLGSDPEYRSAMQTLIDFGKQFAQAGRTKGKQVTRDANAQVAMQDLKHYFVKLSGQSLDDVLHTIKDLRRHVGGSEGYEFRNTSKEAINFIEKSITDKNFTYDRGYAAHGADILRRLRVILFRDHLDRAKNLKGQTDSLMKSVSENDDMKNLRRDVERLVHDLFRDENNNPEFKTTLLSDAGNVLLPAILDKINHIVIPRIEHSNDDFFLAIESMKLTSNTFLPDSLDLKLKHSARVAFREAKPSTLQHRLVLNFNGIHANLQDIPFYYRKKTGFPKIKDYGVADVSMPGDGINTIMKLDVDWANPNRTIIVRKVKVLLEDFKLNIHHTEHDHLFSALAPFFSQTIKKQLKDNLRDQITSAIRQMDYYITLIKKTYIQTPRHPPGEGPAAEGQDESFAGKFLTAAGLIAKRKSTAKKDKGKAPAHANNVGVNGQSDAVDTSGDLDYGAHGGGQGDGAESPGGHWQEPIQQSIDAQGEDLDGGVQQGSSLGR